MGLPSLGFGSGVRAGDSPLGDEAGADAGAAAAGDAAAGEQAPVDELGGRDRVGLRQQVEVCDVVAHVSHLLSGDRSVAGARRRARSARDVAWRKPVIVEITTALSGEAMRSWPAVAKLRCSTAPARSRSA